MIPIYTWLSNALEQEYDVLRMLKESPRGSVQLIRHKGTGQRFILRRFTGNPEVYRKLLEYTCPNLPTVYEVACRGEENLVIEEFIEGDTLGFLLKGALFRKRRPKRSSGRSARPCGSSTPSAPSTGT